MANKQLKVSNGSAKVGFDGNYEVNLSRNQTYMSAAMKSELIDRKVCIVTIDMTLTNYTNGTVLFTLPIVFRPLANILQPIWGTFGGVWRQRRINIQTNGEVRFYDVESGVDSIVGQVMYVTSAD